MMQKFKKVILVYYNLSLLFIALAILCHGSGMAVGIAVGLMTVGPSLQTRLKYWMDCDEI